MKPDEAGQSVIVVGGGVVGIACAHYLAEAGMEVTVIDKGSVAGACSHANCGYICPSHVPPLTEPGAFGVALKSIVQPKSPFRVKPSLDPALWNWMWQFASRCTHQQVLTAGKHLQAILDASMDEYRRLIRDLEIECEWKEDGLLYVFLTERGLQGFANTDRMLTDHFGVSANRIEAAELPDFDPALRPGLAGAFHYPGDTSVRPDRLNRQWADRLRLNGVRFLENCELQTVAKAAGRVRHLITDRGDLSADHYVFSMGAWSARWSVQLQCRIPIQPGKGYSVTLPRPQPCPRHPILFPEHKVGVSPFEDGLRLGSMMEFSGYDESIPQTRIRQLRDSARPYLVASVDGEARETWYGWRPMTWDSLPIIGRVPSLRNALLATGHNMLGLSLAPSTGRLIAELIRGAQPHIDVTPYCPSRFGS
jgi:D-amino-acid dehydrogenase